MCITGGWYGYYTPLSKCILRSSSLIERLITHPSIDVFRVLSGHSSIEVLGTVEAGRTPLYRSERRRSEREMYWVLTSENRKQEWRLAVMTYLYSPGC